MYKQVVPVIYLSNYYLAYTTNKIICFSLFGIGIMLSLILFLIYCKASQSINIKPSILKIILILQLIPVLLIGYSVFFFIKSKKKIINKQTICPKLTITSMWQ